MEDIYSNENNLIEEHNLLLEYLGGIVETYNDPENSLTNNQNFIFLKSKCQTGLKNWEYYYEEIVDDQKCQKIDYKKLTIFAEEANGNLTLYDKIKKEVFLFAPDHSFSNVIKIENQPEYSFYKFSKIQNFNDYVETISKQWILNI
ncbi:hypothetical protein EHR04_04880 [Leptospira levettii]|uniref:hypothetical protein n=1 Tax=Leptospira levettii TaxID=2023178 RepID=UPI0010921DBD|nr:hypothetical protein [Leptospira levettii]TGM79086.1 hypothetical protein EHR04_04880 [Leptospira levettii]